MRRRSRDPWVCGAAEGSPTASSCKGQRFGGGVITSTCQPLAPGVPNRVNTRGPILSLPLCLLEHCVAHVGNLASWLVTRDLSFRPAKTLPSLPFCGLELLQERIVRLHVAEAHRPASSPTSCVTIRLLADPLVLAAKYCRQNEVLFKTSNLMKAYFFLLRVHWGLRQVVLDQHKTPGGQHKSWGGCQPHQSNKDVPKLYRATPNHIDRCSENEPQTSDLEASNTWPSLL